MCVLRANLDFPLKTVVKTIVKFHDVTFISLSYIFHYAGDKICSSCTSNIVRGHRWTFQISKGKLPIILNFLSLVVFNSGLHIDLLVETLTSTFYTYHIFSVSCILNKNVGFSSTNPHFSYLFCYKLEIFLVPSSSGGACVIPTHLGCTLVRKKFPILLLNKMVHKKVK